MNTLLIEGFTDAWRNPGAALRLFWPVVAVILIAYGISFLLAATWFSSDATNIVSFVVAWLTGIIIVLVYVFFILCQGAVGWHRRVLLNERPGWISPVPRRRAFQYALAVFLFVLLMLVAQLAVGFFLTPLLSSLMIPRLQNLNLAGPEIDQLQAVWKAMIPVQIALFLFSVVVISAVLWLARSWLLVFPHISIRTVQPAFGKIKDRLDPPTSLVAALAVVYFLPSLLSLVYTVVTPFRVQLLPWVATTGTILHLMISVFCFLWGLSVLSRTYVMVTAGKVPYEDAA